MQHVIGFLLRTGLYCCILFEPFSLTLAADANPRGQDRYAPSTTGKIIPPFSANEESFAKQQPTTDQKFNLIFSKLTALEQTVATLQNQVTAQAQHIGQLQQVISVQSGGTVTIQAPGTLKIIAGGMLNLAGSKIDLNAAITGAHGILKADTMMTTTVIAQSYTPGAGNIW